jgi:hypothetical protein
MTASSLLKEIKRQRLQTLARAFTERNHLAVQFATAPATDIERTVYLKELDGEIVPGVPASPAECWMAMKAECAHEAGHVLFTDKKAWENACDRGLLFQHIVNVLEDARIERAVANAYPGTLNWFRFFNEYIFRNRQDWGKGAQAFLWGLCSYAAVGKVPDALDPETKSLVEKCKPFVDEARLAKNTWEVLDHAEKVHALVKNAFPAPSLPPVAMTGTDSPREAPQGPLDPRRVSVKRRKQRENDRSPEEPQEDKAGGQTDGEGDRENADGSGESAEKNRSPKEASDGSRDDSGEGSENEPETSEEDGSFGESCGEESGADDAEPDEQSGSGSNEDSEEEADGEGDDPGEDGGSGKTNARDDTGDEDGGGGETGDGEPPASDGQDDEEGSGTEEDDPNDQGGDDEEDDGSGQDADPGNRDGDEQDDEPGPGPSDDGKGDRDDEAPENEEPGDPVAPEPGDEDEEEGPGDEDFSSLLEEAGKELSAMASAAERQEKEAGQSATPEPNWSEVRDEVSRDVHAGCQFKWVDLQARPEEYQALVQAQQGTIRRLVEEIRKALEFKATIPRRNLKKGRLDAGSLWKLRVPDPGVFSRQETPGNVPAVAVYLLVDCSGSMSSRQETLRGTSEKPKIVMAREAAAVLHEACISLKVPHCVVGFNSLYPDTHLYRAVDWEDRDGAKIGGLFPGRANRDGYVIRLVAKEIELRPEPRKVLVVLSDGLPNDNSWNDLYRVHRTSHPVADTARAVRELERKGIGVIGLFFGHDRHLKNAQAIYNCFIYVQDVGHLPVVLGRVLKQAITGGA